MSAEGGERLYSALIPAAFRVKACSALQHSEAKNIQLALKKIIKYDISYTLLEFVSQHLKDG